MHSPRLLLFLTPPNVWNHIIIRSGIQCLLFSQHNLLTLPICTVSQEYGQALWLLFSDSVFCLTQVRGFISSAQILFLAWFQKDFVYSSTNIILSLVCKTLPYFTGNFCCIEYFLVLKSYLMDTRFLTLSVSRILYCNSKNNL